MNTAQADDGETIFKSLGCMSCHKIESSSKVNPSLTEISQAYQGKAAQLGSYLGRGSRTHYKARESRHDEA